MARIPCDMEGPTPCTSSPTGSSQGHDCPATENQTQLRVQPEDPTPPVTCPGAHSPAWIYPPGWSDLCHFRAFPQKHPVATKPGSRVWKLATGACITSLRCWGPSGFRLCSEGLSRAWWEWERGCPRHARVSRILGLGQEGSAGPTPPVTLTIKPFPKCLVQEQLSSHIENP